MRINVGLMLTVCLLSVPLHASELFEDFDSPSKPHLTHKKPILGKLGKKISHQDGQFHAYTIDRTEDRIDFFRDGVHQQTITSLVPDSPARLLVGVRHMSWTGVAPRQ
jgi:hypothetical protein